LEWGHDLDPWETLCFDFSAAPCYGISISEPRIEMKTERKKLVFSTEDPSLILAQIKSIILLILQIRMGLNILEKNQLSYWMKT
jgi:hypothetical protein